MEKKLVLNPYLPSYEYVPDGEPHVFGDRLYIYGSHDRFGGTTFCERDYVCWSAPVEDLSSWRYEGVIYRKDQDPVARETKAYMYAPDVCRGPDGRYYLYYGLDFRNRIAVAVCDTPAGEYAYYGTVSYPDGTVYGGKPGEPLRFDPGVLTDDDGSVYLYTGFSTTGFRFKLLSLVTGSHIDGLGSTVVKLAPDMKTLASEPKRLLPGVANSAGTGFEGHEFYEASSIRKFGGRYCAIYSSVLSHELAWAVSDRPDGGFAYKGALHSNAGIFSGTAAATYWGNNHGSVERVGDRFYIFGHRQTNGTEFSRQGIAEVLELDEKGDFLPAALTTQGLYGEPLPMAGRYEAATACLLQGKSGGCKNVSGIPGRLFHPYFTQEGGDREEAPGQYIANFGSGCAACWRYFRMPDRPVTLTVTFRTHGRTAARGELRVSDCRGGTAAVSARVTCGRETRKASFPLTFPQGPVELWLEYRGRGSIDVLALEFE